MTAPPPAPPAPPHILPPPAPVRRARSPQSAAIAPAKTELRLAIGRDGIGIELARPALVGPILVTELSVRVGGIRFPLDVSGGVSRFRHRRGQLMGIAFEIRARRLERWVASALRGFLGTGTPDVWLSLRKGGMTLGLSAAESGAEVEGGDDASSASLRPPALAFEIAIDTLGEDIGFIVHDARGSDLPVPATALALQVVHELLLGARARARCEGSIFWLRKAVTDVCRHVLPDVGVRAPATDRAKWSAVSVSGDTWLLHASWDGVSAAPTEEAVRARELAALVRGGDDARMRHGWVEARALDLIALERAPRHRAIARRIAEIDRLATGRAEGALALLAEASGNATAQDGLLRGELHLEALHRDEAVAAFVRAAELEEVPALAARAYERAASVTDDPEAALDLLDRAIARAPRSPRLLWARIPLRLSLGRYEAALADVQQLEAQVAHAAAKHLVYRRAGTAFRDAGANEAATTLFERALRFLPDEPECLAAMASAMVAAGRSARGSALMTRAIGLAEDRGIPTGAMRLTLARALADDLNDAPAAIARLRQIPEMAKEAAVARGLEGRYRGKLGDIAGASLAFAKLRDHALSRALLPPGDSPRREQLRDRETTALAALLVEAATFEERERDDALAAQRHLAAALRLRPHDERALTAYRAVGEAVCRRGGPSSEYLERTGLHPERGEARRLDTSSDLDAGPESSAPSG